MLFTYLTRNSAAFQLRAMVWTSPSASETLNPAAAHETRVVTDQSLDNNEIGVLCPDCRHETKKNVGWVKTHTQMECRNCGAIVDIESRNFRVPHDTQAKE
ncbi:hypothetical protein [Mesorhizobium sp. 1M-11]|uniref:hypothetical protein n=1 Tax=Mesorhizobium sp. 1M-11 TaxID=1529006 RepID=UPI0006C747DD|nr:hypothetical protein [Mesorhizobium sp. 1M-11]